MPSLREILRAKRLLDSATTHALILLGQPTDAQAVAAFLLGHAIAALQESGAGDTEIRMLVEDALRGRGDEH